MYVFYILSLSVVDIRKKEVSREKGHNSKEKETNPLHIFSSVDLITSLTYLSHDTDIWY